MTSPASPVLPVGADDLAVTGVAVGLASLMGLADRTAAGRLTAVNTPAGRQIITTLTSIGIPASAARALLLATLTNNPIPHLATTSPTAPSTHPARRAMQATNLLRRAQYLVTAGRRVADDYRARAAGTDTLDERRQALADALRPELAHFRAHVGAQQNRNRVARSVDEAAARWGDQLTWRSRDDERTSRYCAAADGTQFSASRRPALGWPGEVHPYCRCTVGAPDTGAASTYDVPAVD